MAKHVARMERRGTYVKSRKRALIKPRRRLVDSIKMHLPDMGWVSVDWIDLT
jgi:hypothetical protein